MSKTKISPAEKISAVQKYLAGHGSQEGIAWSLGVGHATFQQWIRNYESMGSVAFTMTGRKQYPVELKLKAVMEYISGAGSQDEICKKYGIRARSKLQMWIMRYNSHGDFKQPNSGGDIYMAKGRDTTLEERIEIVSYCIANNKDYGKVIEQYGISYQQIYGWVRKYESGGVDGLVDRRGKRKNESTMTEVEKLRAQIKLKEAENLRLQMENDLLKKLEEIERRRGQG